MNLAVNKPKKFSLWKVIFPVAIIAAIIYYWPLIAPKIIPEGPYTPIALTVSSIEGDAQVLDSQTKQWRAVKRGEELNTGQKIKTGENGIINFQVENEIRLRLKENSELAVAEARVLKAKEIYKLDLSQGVLLGATTRQFERKQKDGLTEFYVFTRNSVVDIQSAIFRIQGSGAGIEEERFGVLRGSIRVAKSVKDLGKGSLVQSLQESTSNDAVSKSVTPDSWNLMKESYELLEKSAAKESEQIDLSKKAGDFFDYVFDHGTFYTPEMGFAGRDFFTDEDTGEVFLENEYDVFPDGSFVGVYIKTRNFDLANYEGIGFDVRGLPGEGTPETFYIEIKSKGNVIRRFSPKTFSSKWQHLEFDFRMKKPTPVSEIVFVYTNARVGTDKKGILEFRRFNLIPKAEDVASAVAVKKAVSNVTTVPKGTVDSVKNVAKTAAESTTTQFKSSLATRPKVVVEKQ